MTGAATTPATTPSRLPIHHASLFQANGVFITTSAFSSAARSYLYRIDSRIVLIDGITLAQLMMDFDIGVTRVATYELKRVDSDYFTGD